MISNAEFFEVKKPIFDEIKCIMKCCPTQIKEKVINSCFYTTTGELHEPLYETTESYSRSTKATHETKEKNVIQKAFQEVIFAERIHQIAYNKCTNDPEYKTANLQVSTLLTQLDSALCDDHQKELLRDLESSWHHMYSYFLEYSYCQGIKDSEMLHQELSKYGISVINKENSNK